MGTGSVQKWRGKPGTSSQPRGLEKSEGSSALLSVTNRSLVVFSQRWGHSRGGTCAEGLEESHVHLHDFPSRLLCARVTQEPGSAALADEPPLCCLARQGNANERVTYVRPS